MEHDGQIEYQIVNTTRHMMKFSYASKLNGNCDKEIAQAIVAGFIGQLCGW